MSVPAAAAPPPPRPRRWKKILLITGGVLLGLLLLAALLIPPIAGAVLRSKVPAALAEALDAEVALDDASFSWSGRITLRGLRALPRNFRDPLLQVDRVEADVSLGAALGGTYVADVDVHGLRVLVERGPDGRFNYEMPPRPPSAGGGSGGGATAPPVVQAALRLQDAEVLLREAGRETRFALAAEAKVDTLQKPIAWSALLTDPAGGRLAAKGDFDLEKKAGPALVTIERLSLGNFAAAIEAYGVPLQSVVGSLDGTLDYRLQGLPAFAGKADLRLAGVDVRQAGRSFVFDAITLAHEGGLDARTAGRQVLALALGNLIRVDVTTEVLGSSSAKSRLELDVDLAAVVAWLRASGLLKADLVAEGRVGLRGSVDAFPLAWNLESTAPRVLVKLDGKPVLLEDVAHRSTGSLDDAGKGRATLSLAAGKGVRADIAANLGDLFKVPDVDATVDASVDLAELGRRFEKLLGLKAGIEGTSTLKASLRAKGGDEARVDLTARTTDLVAIDAAGRKIPLDPLIDVRLRGAWDGRTSTATAETLRLSSSFATADGKGGATFKDGALTIRESTLSLDADLAGLGAKLGVILEKPPALAGKASFRAKAEGEKVSAEGVFAGLRVEGYGPLDATLKHEGAVDPTGDGWHQVVLKSGTAVKAEWRAELKGGETQTAFSIDADLAALAAAVPGLIELKPGVGLEGKASVSGTASLKGQAAAFDVKGELAGLAAVEKKTRTEIDKLATFAAAGAWDGTKRALDLKTLTLKSALATADAQGGFTLTGAPAIRQSSFTLGADLAAIGAKLGLFLADPPKLAGRIDATGSYTGERYDVTATAAGVRVGANGPIDAKLTQKGTLSLAPGGGLSIETSELTSTAVEATLSGSIRKVMDADREGELKLACSLRPAELGKWMPELGLDGVPIPLAATLAMRPKLLTAVGTADVKRLTLTSKGPDGKPVTKVAAAKAAAFELRKAGDDLGATLKSLLVEWSEPGYAMKAGLDAAFATSPKGTSGTTKLVNLEVVDAKKNLVKDPALSLKHDVGMAPESWAIRTLEIDSSFLKGSLAGGIKTPAGAIVFEKVKGSFRYHPDRLGAVAKPWLGGGELGGKDEKTLTLSLEGRAPSTAPFAILRAVRSTMEVDLAYTHTGVTASGRTTLTLENGVLKTSSPLDVNKGKTELTASIDLREAKDKPRSSFDFKAKEVDANADMAPFLASINPIFHTVNGAVAGKSTADFRLAWAGPIDPKTADWTKAAGEHLQGSGTLAVRELAITGSPALALILQAMGEGNQLTGELTGTAITIGKGRCEYRNMTLRLARYELRFTGWVGFDKKMELMVEMPLTPGMRRKYPNLERYTGQTLFVPLEGTASRPRLDFEAAIAEAIKRAAPALLEDALKKLLERKKKDK